jgi:outer membrane protein OmpU
MNNLKKIGLTALAGSLVATSVMSVEMSVSGTAEVTYTTKNGSGVGTSTDSGNPFGSNTSLSFSGAGDVGFGTAKIVRTIGDNMNDASTTASNEYLSAWQTVDMGDLGVLKFDSTGGAIAGLRANRDKLPTAYEEVWTGVSTHGITSAGSDNVVGYSNTFGGATLDLAHKRGSSNGGTGDGGSGSTSTSSADDFYLTLDMGALGLPGASELEGLKLGGGYSKTTSDLAAVDGNNDSGQNTLLMHVNYVSGPVHVGLRYVETNRGEIGSKTDTTLDAWAVAYNVNDSLTVSYAEQDTEFQDSDAANVTETAKALNANYTVGAASVRATLGEASDALGVTGNKDEHMEISLVLSF